MRRKKIGTAVALSPSPRQLLHCVPPAAQSTSPELRPYRCPEGGEARHHFSFPRHSINPCHSNRRLRSAHLATSIISPRPLLSCGGQRRLPPTAHNCGALVDHSMAGRATFKQSVLCSCAHRVVPQPLLQPLHLLQLQRTTPTHGRGVSGCKQGRQLLHRRPKDARLDLSCVARLLRPEPGVRRHADPTGKAVSASPTPGERAHDFVVCGEPPVSELALLLRWPSAHLLRWPSAHLREKA